MRVIIAGSRGITDVTRLNRAILASQMGITRVISGTCKNSPDEMGEAWAARQDPKIPVTPMAAKWDEYGKRAGMIRNCEMAKEAEGLIALWDGVSPGTRHMITEAVSKGLHHYIDAACSNCGTLVDVAIYRFVSDAGPLDQIRATCRSCLERRLRRTPEAEALSFFDAFAIWGRHQLHVTLPRLRLAEPKLPLPLPPRTVVEGLVFGQKNKKETKVIRPLTKYQEQPRLF